MKTKSIIISIILILSLSNIINSQNYFSDGVEVPVFEGTIIPNMTTKFVYWDLGEVNSVNNRLDFVAGVSQKGYDGGSGNYIIGNWYFNQFNNNFNTEVVNNRFIESFTYTNPITGLIFAKLSSNPSVNKEIIISRNNEEIEIYSNSGGVVSFSLGFKANGFVSAVGNFTYGDNLEDVAVIADDTVKIYKNLGNGYLDSIPIFCLANVNAKKIILAQINSYILPYSMFYETTADKDDIILLQGDSIRIYNNDNNNGASLSTIIYTGSPELTERDFSIADLNKDGFNDLIIAENGFGLSVYKNTGSEISNVPSYRNVYETFHTFTAASGDFDKNGWNDMVICLDNKMNLYINNKSDSLYTQEATEAFYYDYPLRVSCRPLKTVVSDVYNKGGLAVIFSNFGDIIELSPEDPLNEIEQVARINASDTDAVPAPAYLFRELVQIGEIYRPKLILYNRGDRDFLKYKIYKKSPFTNYVYTLIDSTADNYYIDYQETFTVGSGGSRPPDNCFYYVKAEDYSYKVSENSDTIGYPTVLCPSCPNEENMYSSKSNLNIELPVKYSITNFPNPFNPSTKLFFTVPTDGNVKITVYNSIGQKVNEIVNEYKSSGSYLVEFDGAGLPSGVYFYKLEAGSFVETRRMLLIK